MVVHDLNLEVLEGTLPGGPELIELAADRVAREAPALVGLSSMGVNAHVALLLATAIRLRCPDTLVVLGSASFSAIAPEVLRRFPAVDAVVVGPGEDAFGLLCDLALAAESPADALRSLARRHPDLGGWGPAGQIAHRGSVLVRDGASVHAVPPPPAVERVRPAWDLVDLRRYFRCNPRRVLDIDGGLRGCRFSCRYCYVPAHWGRPATGAGDQLEGFLDEVRAARAHGAARLFFVYDNFIDDPAQAIQRCAALRQAGLATPFQCYATLGQLTATVIDALAGAGCREVYVGVDAVDLASRNAWRKHLFRSGDDLRARLAACVAAGIRPTAAFLFDPARASSEHPEETVRGVLEARAVGCSVRLNVLARYPGTELGALAPARLVADDARVRLAMDLPPVVIENPLAEHHADLFPFHVVENPEEDRLFQLAVHALYTFCKSLPDTMGALANRRMAWQTSRAIASELAGEEFLALPDGERRERELAALAARISRDWGGTGVADAFQTDLAVLSLLSGPEWVEVELADGRRVHHRPFKVVLTAGQGADALIVNMGGILEIRDLPPYARASLRALAGVTEGLDRPLSRDELGALEALQLFKPS